MKEFIEKLIERLGEESKKWLDKFEKEHRRGNYDQYSDGMNDAFDESISIVNQLAEEYKGGCKMVVNEDIKNPFANISTVGCVNCDHKDEYIIELESNSNGWIPCSERLPIGEEYHKRIDGVDYYKHMLVATNDIDAPICVGWYDQEDEIWFDLEGFIFYPVAWMPLLEPYRTE